MITITIPNQEGIECKHVPKKNGPGEWVFTEFEAIHEGRQVRCQAWDDVSWRIRAAMGGSLLIESIEPGKWGTYKVRLPHSATTATAAPGPASSADTSRRVITFDEWVNQSKHVLVNCPDGCDAGHWLIAYWRAVATGVVNL